MSKKYLYNDNLLSYIDQNGESVYISSFDEIEEDSILLFLSSELKYYINEDEIYDFLSTDDDIKSYKNINVFKDIIENKIYTTNIPKTFIKDYYSVKRKKRKIKLVNFLTTFKYILKNYKLIKQKNLTYLFTFEISEDDKALLVLKNEEDGFVIDKLLKLSASEISSYLIEIKRKNESLGILTILISNYQIEENVESVFNDNNRLKKEFEEQEWFENIIKQINDTFIIYDKDIDVYQFAEKAEETEILNLYEYFMLLKNRRRKKLIAYALLFLIFGAINYYIHFPMLEGIKKNYDETYYNYKQKYEDLEKKQLLIESKKWGNIIKKEYGNEWLVVPYIYTYLNHFNINIEKIEVNYDDKDKRYYGNFIVHGLIPDNLLVFLKYKLGMKSFDIMNEHVQLKNGNKYLLVFDLKETEKILKNKGIM